MKRFLVSILVPASAAIAVVGSGFSVWYFGDNEVSKNTSANLNVKNLLQIGELNHQLDDLVLTFDQTAEGRKAALKLNNNKADTLEGLEATGITLSGKAGQDMKITYTLPTDPKADHGTFGDVTVKTKITTSVKIEADLAEWLTVTETSNVVKATDGSFVYTWADLPENSADTTRELKLDGIFTFAYAAYNSQYTTADRGGFGTCEPLNATEYETMRTALNGLNGKVTFVTKAEIVKA